MVKLARGPAFIVPAANRHQRHQCVTDNDLVGFAQRIGAHGDFNNAKRRWCQLSENVLTHNAVDSRPIEARGKDVKACTPEYVRGTAFRKPPFAVKDQRLIGVRLLKMRTNQHLLKAIKVFESGK